MKPFLVLFLLVSPLVALNATEKAPTTVKSSETNLESADHSSAPVTTDSPATATPIKNNNIHQTDATPKEEKKLDPKFLHRIPVFRDRNPLVETIKKFENEFQGLKNGHKTEDDKKETNSTSELELPIPSRCPHITGTAEEDVKAEHKADWVPLLGASSKSKAAQRGCRFFIMNELMERSTSVFAHSTPEAQLNRTLNSCFHSCVQAYDNGTDVCNACFDGCRKTAAVTEDVKKAMPAHEGDELEREDGEHNPDMHRTFSIIIPLRTFPEIEGNEQNNDGAQPEDGGAFPSMMPNAIRMMLQMMHQMTERARQVMIQQQQGQPQSPLASGSGGSNIQESEVSIDPSGSISVSRSMSVLMTKDKDGHSKMVVVHTLPKIQVHRFGQGGHGLFGTDDEDRFHDLADGKEHSDGDDDELMEDGDDLRVRLFGHLSKTTGHNHQAKDTLDEKELGASSTQVYYYRSRLCYYLPRLFYLTLIILILYVIFWLFCAVPTALYGRNARRNSLDSNVSMISGGANGNDGDAKRKKFYFTKNAKYFQLNNKRNSTVSLPPPYPGAEDAASCAEPLPEKQPLPEGGIEIKLDDGDKK